MSPSRIIVALGCFLLTIAPAAPEQRPGGDASGPPAAKSRRLAIRFGRVVDGGGKVVKNAVVLVEGDRIVSVGGDPGAAGREAGAIDLSRYTGLPGLIDVHTHLTYSYDPDAGKGPWQQLTDRHPAIAVFLARDNARRTLEAGVTTVRDLGAQDYDDVAMRDLIQKGLMPGPRMLVCGYGLYTTYAAAKPGKSEFDGALADGVPEVLRVVRQQLGAGVDVIKMFASWGGGEDLDGHQTFTFDEIKAAVDTAHQAGKKIAVHSYGPDGARAAVRAGADSIEHAVDLDDATLAEMARRKIVYVPTIDHNRYYADNRALFGYSEEAAGRLREFVARNVETTRRAIRAGVPIAMGSDAVFTGCGENTRELEWLVKAGMTPAQALAAATATGATLLGMEKDLGVVAPGAYADLVAVEGDPLADVGAVVHGVRWVMKAGAVVVDRTAAPAGSASP